MLISLENLHVDIAAKTLANLWGSSFNFNKIPLVSC